MAIQSSLWFSLAALTLSLSLSLSLPLRLHSAWYCAEDFEAELSAQSSLPITLLPPKRMAVSKKSGSPLKVGCFENLGKDSNCFCSSLRPIFWRNFDPNGTPPQSPISSPFETPPSLGRPGDWRNFLSFGDSAAPKSPDFRAFGLASCARNPANRAPPSCSLVRGARVFLVGIGPRKNGCGAPLGFP